MLNLLGEYDCKLDAKGRFMLPSALKKQLTDVLHEGFVVNRDVFENCLALYPAKKWEEVSKEVNGLNRFVKKNALFIRRFTNGATLLELDASGRLLLPKPLVEYAGLSKEIVVSANVDRIDIWTKEAYLEMLKEDDVDFGTLAEEVMGDKPTPNE